MAYTPAGVVYLCDVPLDLAQKNQIYFADKTARNAYFASKVKKSYTQFSYQRQDSVIKVNEHIDSLWDCNYCYYTNDQNPNKTFFAYITNLEWLSNSSTAVHIKTDVFQTYFLDCTLLASFVAREHIENDTIGANTLPEELETGPYMKVNTTRATEITDLAIIIGVTMTAGGIQIRGRRYGGIFSGLAYFAYFGAYAIPTLESDLQEYDTAGRAEAVKIMFTYPSALLPTGTVSGQLMESDFLLSPAVIKSVNYSNVTINGYTPKNKKLFCWPYNFLHVSNLQGQSADFQFERLTNNNGTFNFTIYGSLSPGAKVGCFPSGYNNDETQGLNFEEALTLQNYPLCSWTSTPWENWIALNAVSITSTAAAGVAGIAAGIATANPLMAVGGVAAVGSQVQQIFRQMAEPEQARGNINGSALNIATGIQTFEFSQMQIRQEYAKVIDQYFEMYGYKTNQVKVPNISSRPYWNFVQTVDCNITGDVPSFDMTELKKIFDSGVTIWKHGNYIGNYTYNNH